jgi:phosphatidylinositol-bisphosphatase
MNYLLNTGDKCLFSTEILVSAHQHKKILYVVSPKNSKEYAIFLIDDNKIEHIIPINSDFYLFLGSSFIEMNNIEFHTSNISSTFVEISKFNKQSNKQGSFDWIRAYNETANPLINIDNKKIVQRIKEEWVTRQLNQRESEFTNYRSLSLFVGTWNVNGKLSTENLAPWLVQKISKPNDIKPCEKSSNTDPDLYVIGFQELDLSAEAFLLNDSPREEFWAAAVENTLSTYVGSPYRKIASKQLVGILILVYGKKNLCNMISDVQCDSQGCGIMGMMGNKGGVAVRMKVLNSVFCFVNSHLAAHVNEVERRRQDYSEISRRLQFSSSTIPNQLFSIWDSDILLWFGDLNYRITLSELKVKEMLDNISSVLAFDQLNIEKRAGRAFFQFDEAPIKFLPSYKYDPGTNNYDSSEKRRAPSWTDRILWRKGDKIINLGYLSHSQLLASDHKPVSALFCAHVKETNIQEKELVYQKVLWELDRFENECMPDAKLSETSISFGSVKYKTFISRTIQLDNIGRTPTQFVFVPKLDEKEICKPWLTIKPQMSMLMPGEKMTIELTIFVDNSTVSDLNINNNMEDIIILHLENGKDFFISISATFLPTFFGFPLTLAANIEKPIRESEREDFVKSYDENPRLNVPKELYQIVDYIYVNGKEVGDLFITSGDPELIPLIIEHLDSGKPIPKASEKSSDYEQMRLRLIHSVAEILVQYLEALPIPVIPPGAIHNACLEASGSYELSLREISNLPIVHLNVFTYIIAYLKEIVLFNDSEKLATIFASLFLRDRAHVLEKHRLVVEKRKTAFILNFLRHRVPL